MSNVSGVIKSIQDIMRKDVGVDGDAQRISQLVWMFFLKILMIAKKNLNCSKTTTNPHYRNTCAGGPGPKTRKV
jgi:type I restriction-modification system DNA methylase subunit